MANLLAKKTLEMIQAEGAEHGEHTLRRVLGPVNLMTLGIGAIIGAGIFVLTGAAAAKYAGPAIVLSFVLAGLGLHLRRTCATRSLPRSSPLPARLTLTLTQPWVSFSPGLSVGT